MGLFAYIRDRSRYKELDALARDIAPAGVDVYERGVDGGEWYIIAGTKTMRVKFFWDWRDHVMLVYECHPPFRNEDWKCAAIEKLRVEADMEREPYHFIKQVLRGYFGDKIRV
jgi:hypothetical protein